MRDREIRLILENYNFQITKLSEEIEKLKIEMWNHKNPFGVVCEEYNPNKNPYKKDIIYIDKNKTRILITDCLSFYQYLKTYAIKRRINGGIYLRLQLIDSETKKDIFITYVVQNKAVIEYENIDLDEFDVEVKI